MKTFKAGQLAFSFTKILFHRTGDFGQKIGTVVPYLWNKNFMLMIFEYRPYETFVALLRFFRVIGIENRKG